MKTGMRTMIGRFLPVAAAVVVGAGHAEARRLGDLPMSRQVRERWSILLGAAGLSLAPEDIELPTKPVSTKSFPFRVFERSIFQLESRKFLMVVHSQTGEPLIWGEYTESDGPAVPQRQSQEARARIESLAAALLPAATERLLIRGPEYSDNSGAWIMSWRRTYNGIPFDLNGYSIDVYDSDLSLHSFKNHGFSPKPTDMTVAIQPEKATQIALETAKPLQKLAWQLDTVGQPEGVGEPSLVITAYCPEFKEKGWCSEDLRKETRLAWEVLVCFPSQSEDRPRAPVHVGWKIWVDAKTGEVVGGTQARVRPAQR